MSELVLHWYILSSTKFDIYSQWYKRENKAKRQSLQASNQEQLFTFLSLNMEYPKLRNIDAFPTKVSGNDVICLRDPFNYTEQMLIISHNILNIIKMFDGKHSIIDIQKEYLRKNGLPLPIDELKKIIEKMDSHLFLESENFEKYHAQVLEDFQQLNIRAVTSAGSAYALEPEKLDTQIEGYFKNIKSDDVNKNNDHKSQGIIAPHIDIIRAGNCFASAYNEIKNHLDFDVYVILGTAHYPCKNFFALTKKDFATPFGVIETDREFVDLISKNGNQILFEDEFVHKTEHSIEFQLIFLQYLFRNKRKIKIVPILCSSFHEAIIKGISPSEIPQISNFISLLKKTIESYNEKVCLIASVDLAHIGIRFGDGNAPTKNDLDILSEDDLKMLKFVEDVNPEGFYNSIKSEADKRRICGFPAIYTFLNIINSNSGTLLKYEQSQDDKTGSAVTFASMFF